MKVKFFCLFSAFLALILGLRVGGGFTSQPLTEISSASEREFPVSEYKTFAVVIYAYNQAEWCERALRSIVSQDYENFRVFFIDDASSDDTLKTAKSFILETNQGHRVTVIHNDSHLGEACALYRVIDSLLDKEIVVPIQGKDWFAHSGFLNTLNRAYQNPEIWLTFSRSIVYPTYQTQDEPDINSPTSFYSAIFKQIYLNDLMREKDPKFYLKPLTQLVGSHFLKIQDLSVFENKAQAVKTSSPLKLMTVQYMPLACFPKKTSQKEKADILIFSCDRPLQLYACLESIYQYMSGFETLSVLYRASNEQFAAGYKKLKKDFPQVHFVAQSNNYKKDFKPLLMKTAFKNPSKYILFGVDDIVVKDFTDLNTCMEFMEKTNAYGFYLRFGKHISYCYQAAAEQSLPLSLPVANGVYAWKFDQASYDWAFPNSVDMTLYRKKNLEAHFKLLKFNAPNSLEFSWARECRPKESIGLYFESSKIVNIPFNIVSRTGNPHMNYLSASELLVKFEQGLKMDIRPLHQVQNSSPHFEYLPEFIAR